MTYPSGGARPVTAGRVRPDRSGALAAGVEPLTPAAGPAASRAAARRLGDAHLWLEVSVCVLLYLGFSSVQELLGHDVVRADADARAVQAVEERLGLHLEVAVNGWTARHAPVAHLAALVYEAVLPLVPLVLLAVARLAPARYGVERTRLAVLSLASLPVFWLFPVAPPRLAEAGIVDVVAHQSLIGSAMSPTSAFHEDVYAATPSLHVAWSVWCALVLFPLVRERRRGLAPLVLLLPAVVAVDVVATGNHYVVDVAAGVALALLTAAGVRRRPAHRSGLVPAGAGRAG